MIPLNKRISLLSYIGELFRDISSEKPAIFVQEARQLKQLLPAIEVANPWFTADSVLYAIRSWGESLHQDKIEKWLEPYELAKISYKSRDILVIMAGNIPLVGLHDFISVLSTGHRFTGKMSSKDRLIFPMIREWICNFDKIWEDYINFTADAVDSADYLIATGSNNTSRIIGQNYAGAKSIIRHNRNSIALLDGEETDSELEKLADDILLYYGLGCRNVSTIFIPRGYRLDHFAGIIRKYNLALPESIINNLKYQKALARMHNKSYIDAGKVIMIAEDGLNSPIGTVYYSEYSDINEIRLFRSANRDNIQCAVGNPGKWEKVIDFGKAQNPALDDYADGIDTIEFLINLG